MSTLHRLLRPAAPMLALAAFGAPFASAAASAPHDPSCSPESTPRQEDEGDGLPFQSLFDGETLAGWVNYKTMKAATNWGVEDGALVRLAGGGDLVTALPYDHFEFRFEWKISEGGNSGVMYRVKAGDSETYLSGPEYQILDDRAEGLDDKSKTAAGALYGLIAAEGKELRPVAEFNSARIVLQGNHLEHWLNGKKVVEVELHGERWNELVKNSKFNAWAQFGQSPMGHIALQDHGQKVWYRNLRLRPLPPPDAEEDTFADITPGSSLALLRDRLGTEDFALLDVRTPPEVAAGHLEGMECVDYKASGFREKLDQLDRDRTYLVYCRSGRRSGKALEMMREMGFHEVYNMHGGWLRWTAEKRPSTKHRP